MPDDNNSPPSPDSPDASRTAEELPRPVEDNAVDLFAPSWKRFLFAAALAFLAFLVPQEIALEWYPLNEPGNDIHYLEATMRSSNTGTLRFVYDSGFGFKPPYDITVPIAPSDMAFTYTFPLPDGPLRKLFIDPPDAPGEVEFTRLRIINRREEEMRNFFPDEFKLSPGLELQRTEHGWKLISDAKTSFDAGADIDFSPIRPIGMNGRNFLRCLLSWSYLSFMLWLIVLAIYFTFLNHRRGKDILRATAFLLAVCCLFSFVGNRGLIKNAYAISKKKPVSIPPGHELVLEVAAAEPGEIVFTQTPAASPLPEKATTQKLSGDFRLQTLRLPLADSVALKELQLRLPPGRVKLMPIRLLNGGKYTALEIPVAALTPPAEHIHRASRATRQNTVAPPQRGHIRKNVARGNAKARRQDFSAAPRLCGKLLDAIFSWQLSGYGCGRSSGRLRPTR
jgi:hypothetical protein